MADIPVVNTTEPIDVSAKTAAIRSAVYGEEVRESIASAIDAIQGSYEQYTGANGAIRTANEAHVAAIDAQDSCTNLAAECNTLVHGATNSAEAYRDEANTLVHGATNSAEAYRDECNRLVNGSTNSAKAYRDETQELTHGATDSAEYYRDQSYYWSTQSKLPLVRIPDEVINDLWPTQPEE